jgi:predicted lipoprotein with Yx(FWY)xxD motif
MTTFGKSITWGIVLIIIVLGGWYFLSAKPTEEVLPSKNLGLNDSENQTNTGQRSIGPTLKVASSPELGDYLVALNGMTLYRYTKDTVGKSNCFDTCLANWPAYAPLTGEPLSFEDSIKGEVSTITRPDGTEQITYNGVPLYFWINDKEVGDTTGQNVGGVWFVVKP